MAIPLKALESTSLMPTTRSEMGVLFAIDAFEGAGVSSLIALRESDRVLSRIGASLMEETTICAELELVENAEVPPEAAVVA